MGYTFPLVGWLGKFVAHGGTEKGGSDIFAPVGTRIVSISAGTVVAASNDGLGGNIVMVHEDATGLDYYYAHMRDLPLVKAGQRVVSGQPLGYVGTTGNAVGTDPHLHLGIGYGISQGAGAAGGVGKGFDAIAFLAAIFGGGQPTIERVATGGGSGGAFGGVGDFFERLGDPALWGRVLAVLVGAALLIGGVLLAFSDQLIAAVL